jgi:hypothetical protein
LKAHLKDSEDPLIEGQDYTAVCGKMVHKAAFTFVFTQGELSHISLSTIMFCKDCIKTPPLGPLSGRYLYGMVDGETAKQAEIEP